MRYRSKSAEENISAENFFLRLFDKRQTSVEGKFGFARPRIPARDGMPVTVTLKSNTQAWESMFHPGRNPYELFTTTIRLDLAVTSAITDVKVAIKKYQEVNKILDKLNDHIGKLSKSDISSADFLDDLAPEPGMGDKAEDLLDEIDKLNIFKHAYIPAASTAIRRIEYKIYDPTKMLEQREHALHLVEEYKRLVVDRLKQEEQTYIENIKSLYRTFSVYGDGDEFMHNFTHHLTVEWYIDKIQLACKQYDEMFRFISLIK